MNDVRAFRNDRFSDRYALNDIYPAIQGEGAKSGTPMIMIRLQGCDVGCPWCDTKETWRLSEANGLKGLREPGEFASTFGKNRLWTRATAISIAEYANKIRNDIRWTLISGGEPAEHHLSALVCALRDEGFKIALETSGTAAGWQDVTWGIDWFCLSPKIGMPGGREVQEEAWLRADEIKMVVGKQRDIDVLREHLDRIIPLRDKLTFVMRGNKRPVISLQPVSLSKTATTLCVETCLREGWNLSVQTHQLLGLP